MFDTFDSFNPPTIASATSSDLINARNTAYIELGNAYKQSKADVERLQSELTYFRNLTAKLVDASSTRSTPPFSEGTHPTASTTLRISTEKHPQYEDQANHPDVPFWHEWEWQKRVERNRDKGRIIDKLGFLTDSDGTDLSKIRMKRISEGAKMIWNELKQHSLHPSSWKKKTKQAEEFFVHHMLSDFPEFRLANNHWKLERFAIVRYPDWIASLSKEVSERSTDVNTLKRRIEDHNNSSNWSKSKKRRRQSSPPDGVPLSEINDNEVEQVSTPAQISVAPTPQVSTPAAQVSVPISSQASISTAQVSTPTLQVSAPTPQVFTPAAQVSLPIPSQASVSTAPVSSLTAQVSTPTPQVSAPTPQVSAPAAQVSLPIPSQASVSTAPVSSLTAQVSTPTPQVSAPAAQVSLPIPLQVSSLTAQVSTPTPQVSAPAVQLSVTSVFTAPNVFTPLIQSPPLILSQSLTAPNTNDRHASITSGPPQFYRPTMRRILDPLKNVSIPPPSITIPQTTSSFLPTLNKKPNSKPLQAKDGVTTARNLYVVEYLAMHPNTTEAEFAAAWKACDAETKKKYQAMSKERTKAKKIANQLPLAQPHPTSSLSGTTDTNQVGILLVASLTMN
ncbi:hypothetical protein C0992_009820 [Termitomyces sp. T32_za158]|nr:hypothetical protein C0992_009820 [Termitomyces sp. T32_za158]